MQLHNYKVDRYTYNAIRTCDDHDKAIIMIITGANSHATPLGGIHGNRCLNIKALQRLAGRM